MTIHFHTKHFQELPLALDEYFMLLIYSNSLIKHDELCKQMKLSDRTVYRIRESLITKGYLKRGKRTRHPQLVFTVTDKAYLKDGIK